MKHANSLTVVSSFVLIFSVIYQAIKEGNNQQEKEIKMYPSGLNDVLYAFPFFLLSFVAQFTVLPVYCELKERKKMKNVSKFSIFLGFFMYTLISTAGYLVGGKGTFPFFFFLCFNFFIIDTCDNVLSNMPNDFIAFMARFCLILTLSKKRKKAKKENKIIQKKVLPFLFY